MKDGLVIRNYLEADYSMLKEMVFGLYADDLTMSENNIRNTINRSISHPEAIEIKIFEVAHTVAGYAIITSFWSNEYNGLVKILDELYLLPAHRNQGISTKFIDQLSQSNPAAILLEVLKYNTKALSLYERLGFEIVDRYFMVKRLK